MKKIGNRKSKTRNAGAFTLIELLVVIAIMGILAALIVPVMSSMKRTAYINKARAEMAQLETAIDGYHAAYNFYPPGNANATPANLTPALVNPLYYELAGTTNTGGSFTTLDGSATISPATATSAFGVAGFVNCTTGSGEDARAAKNFLLDLNAKQIGTADGITNLVCSVGGPDQNYTPMGASYPGVNPWRYLYPGANNPNGYDLWIQLVIGGHTNLVCNWSSQVQINSPMP